MVKISRELQNVLNLERAIEETRKVKRNLKNKRNKLFRHKGSYIGAGGKRPRPVNILGHPRVPSAVELANADRQIEDSVNTLARLVRLLDEAKQKLAIRAAEKRARENALAAERARKNNLEQEMYRKQRELENERNYKVLEEMERERNERNRRARNTQRTQHRNAMALAVWNPPAESTVGLPTQRGSVAEYGGMADAQNARRYFTTEGKKRPSVTFCAEYASRRKK